jgi:hypothetical protein
MYPLLRVRCTMILKTGAHLAVLSWHLLPQLFMWVSPERDLLKSTGLAESHM